MIVELKSFKGCIAIDGINGDTMSSEAIMDKLTSFIEIYEDEYLSMLLGPAKDEFISSIKSISDHPRWANLLYLLMKDISPIACYVFFHFVRDTNYSITGTGVNSEGRSCYNVCTRAWNEMIKTNEKILSLFESGGYEDVQMNDALTRAII